MLHPTDSCQAKAGSRNSLMGKFLIDSIISGSGYVSGFRNVLLADLCLSVKCGPHLKTFTRTREHVIKNIKEQVLTDYLAEMDNFSLPCLYPLFVLPVS